ncbi:MAG: UMP kinase [Patescibacteria group bacterium]
MNNKQSKTIVISLGGSLIAPDGVDVKYLKQFKKTVLTRVKQGYRFCIITGGGKMNKRYNQAAKQISKIMLEDLDWIGIACTWLHAHLLRSIFGKQAHPRLYDNPAKLPIFTRPILLGGGYRPGHSSDVDAVLVAKTLKVSTVINLSDIDHVYDKDPDKYPKAKPFKQISWSEYLKIIPKKWKPRLNSPFDPEASRLAKNNNISVFIIKGQRLSELGKALSGKTFQGTIIK